MYKIWKIMPDKEGRVLAYCKDKKQALELIEMLHKPIGINGSYWYLGTEDEEEELVEEPYEVNSVVPIYRVSNYTDHWQLIGFTLSVEEANKVVKALCWRDMEDCTFRYVAGSSFIDRIRVEDVENM